MFYDAWKHGNFDVNVRKRCGVSRLTSVVFLLAPLSSVYGQFDFGFCLGQRHSSLEAPRRLLLPLLWHWLQKRGVLPEEEGLAHLEVRRDP